MHTRMSLKSHTQKYIFFRLLLLLLLLLLLKSTEVLLSLFGFISSAVVSSFFFCLFRSLVRFGSVDHGSLWRMRTSVFVCHSKMVQANALVCVHVTERQYCSDCSGAVNAQVFNGKTH